ncbi:MAG: adenylosuccinate synthase [Halobacteriales archaeon]
MVITIVGAQMGDEGKGGIVDVVGADADVVVRYQGGDNAGHTVVVGGEEYKLSLVPSGVVRGATGVLGNGCVVNPRTFFEEVDALRERGLDPDVRVAGRAHVIMPYHRVLDDAEEAAKSAGDLAAGTTGRGIGPTYEDKAARRGVRVADLLDPAALRDRLEYVVPRKRRFAEAVFDVDTGTAFDVEALHGEFVGHGERLAEEGLVVDAGAYLTERLEAGDHLIYEGAQGTSLDIDHGIYPYTTSSNPTSGFATTGSGVAPRYVAEGSILGVVKAYLSRVGGGPLPTELEGDLADRIRERGGEYGTVTGRPRRIGWLDLPMVRTAARTSGFTGLAINHVDVLAGLEEVRVATAYDLDGERLEAMPLTTERWGRCEPTYETFDGWDDVDWSDVAEAGYDALPANARAYLDFVADAVGVPIALVGVGPGREQTIVLDDDLT